MIKIADYVSKVNQAVEYIKLKLGEFRPQTAIVLGSGLGAVANEIKDAVVLDAKDIPNWPVSTAPGHAGKVIFGKFEGRPVALLQGRVHFYEGYSMRDISFNVRVLGLLGIKEYIATNASGAINFQAGDIAAVIDHINYMGENPLRGESLPWNTRFPDMSHAYNPELIKLMDVAAEKSGVDLKHGVYIAFSGPSYETPAEIKMAKALGADLVGMSTVPEVIVANAMGIKTGVLSCAANLAAGISATPLSEREVLDAMAKSAGALAAILRALMRELNAR